MKALVTIAIFNEGRSLPSFLEKRKTCPKDLPGVDFLFVDDGSDDNAWEILQSRGIPYVRHEINLGQGIACNTGMLAAIRLGYDVVITMDGDGQHDFSDIPVFLQCMETTDADIVVGSRILGSNHGDAAFVRRFFLPHVTWVVNRLSGYRLTDAMCGFRAYRVESLKRVVGELSNLMEGEYTAAELFMRFGRAGLKVREVPVSLNNRIVGRSHKGMVKYGMGILRAIARTLMDRHYWR